MRSQRTSAGTDDCVASLEAVDEDQQKTKKNTVTHTPSLIPSLGQTLKANATKAQQGNSVLAFGLHESQSPLICGATRALRT